VGFRVSGKGMLCSRCGEILAIQDPGGWPNTHIHQRSHTKCYFNVVNSFLHSHICQTQVEPKPPGENRTRAVVLCGNFGRELRARASMNREMGKVCAGPAGRDV
jgi:hypothetical protein